MFHNTTSDQTTLLMCIMLMYATIESPLLHCMLAAAQCIVIGPVCLFVRLCVGLLPR